MNKDWQIIEVFDEDILIARGFFNNNAEYLVGIEIRVDGYDKTLLEHIIMEEVDNPENEEFLVVECEYP